MNILLQLTFLCCLSICRFEKNIGRTGRLAAPATSTICNPVDLSYRFVLDDILAEQGDDPHREAADPSMVFFKDEFYLFASKSGGYFHSKDMINWDLITTTELENQEGYAPAAIVADNAILWITSGDGRLYRSTDPASGHWTMETWEFPQKETDPALLWDNGRLYWYGGCSDENPIWAVEINASTYKQIGERVVAVRANVKQLGWEQNGEFNQGTNAPWIEGSFATKIGDTYYLEYSAPGTETSYASAVYTSKQPLGPFTLQVENPLTIKETGFACGAGHGSVYQDRFGNYWHVSTVAIGVRAMFERRLQINPLFVDADGAFWGYTGFGDWPMKVPTGKIAGPEELSTGAVLLSYNKPAVASSTLSGHAAALAVDENIRTWWSADTAAGGEWFRVDLGAPCNISGVQVNHADQDATVTGRADGVFYRYVVEGSVDGEKYTLLQDYSTQTEDHPHQYTEVAATARYIRVTSTYTPSGKFSLSGLRVFGVNPAAAKPSAPTGVQASRLADRRGAAVTWSAVAGATGYNIRFGTGRTKLYQNMLVYGGDTTRHDVRYLNAEVDYVFTVDAFGEGGVTQGTEISNA